MKNNKVITICGSMKYSEEMKKIALQLELEQEFIVFQCVYNENDKVLSKVDKDLIGKIHYKKIDLSDAIYVVNIDGYIGESTSEEIEYAMQKGKEIIYHEKLLEE